MLLTVTWFIVPLIHGSPTQNYQANQDAMPKANLNVLFSMLTDLLPFVAPAGNFNGNPKDDNLKPDNTPAANTNELGGSWQVPDPRPE